MKRCCSDQHLIVITWTNMKSVTCWFYSSSYSVCIKNEKLGLKVSKAKLNFCTAIATLVISALFCISVEKSDFHSVEDGLLSVYHCATTKIVCFITYCCRMIQFYYLSVPLKNQTTRSCRSKLPNQHS